MTNLFVNDDKTAMFQNASVTTKPQHVNMPQRFINLVGFHIKVNVYNIFNISHSY